MTQRLRWTGVLLSLPFLAVLAAFTLFGCGTAPEATIVSQATPQAQQAESEAPFPLPVLEISGSPEALGTRHGQQLGDTIRSLHNDYLNAYFKSQGQRFLALSRRRGVRRASTPNTSPKSAPGQVLPPPRTATAAQCFLDLSPMTACSTVTLPASASPTASPASAATSTSSLTWPTPRPSSRSTAPTTAATPSWPSAGREWPACCPG